LIDPLLRQMEPADISAVCEIYNYEVINGIATFDTVPRSNEQIATWLLDQRLRTSVRVAVVDHFIAGFSGLYPWSPRRAYDRTAENTVYVAPQYRGQGLGRILLNATLKLAPEHNVHTIIARVTAQNLASLLLHEKLGFRKVGVLREVGEKFGQLLDVALLQQILPND
jgi:L-amino acid N-acyltransferase YncA